MSKIINLFKKLPGKEIENKLGDAAWEKTLQDILNMGPGMVKGVEIHAADDCCPYCRKFKNKRFDLEHIPVLPHEGCTSEYGCRCTMYPIWKF
jgi:hypothetical protein